MLSSSESPRLSTLLQTVRSEFGCRIATHLLIYATGAFLNDTVLPDDFNYLDPTVPFFINGKDDPTSQRLHVSLLIEGILQ
jgi:hypothetical protein